MKSYGYTNEHGTLGMHSAYGIRLFHLPLVAETEILIKPGLQKQVSKIIQMYPMVQLIQMGGIVSYAEVTHDYNIFHLRFNPAFTGHLVAIVRAFNLHYHSQAIASAEEQIDHYLDAPGFMTVVDDDSIEIEGEYTILDNDSLNIHFGSAITFEAGVHALSNPMFRKYYINTSDDQTLVHNLGTSGLIRPPYVMVTDIDGLKVEPEIKHIDMNSLVLRFSEAFEGYAYLLMG